jgi:hypothetical protein
MMSFGNRGKAEKAPKRTFLLRGLFFQKQLKIRKITYKNAKNVLIYAICNIQNQ